MVPMFSVFMKADFGTDVARVRGWVLVLLFITAVISLALGFFQCFGLGWELEKPPVNWIVGAITMVHATDGSLK